jgi:hypothetical protein
MSALLDRDARARRSEADMARAPLFPRRRPRTPRSAERTLGLILLLALGIVVGLFVLSGTRAGPPGLPERTAEASPSGPWPALSPSGWPRGEAGTYDERTLYEKIDGKAESYLAYDFRSLAFSSYVAPDGAAYVDVYLYDMGAPLDAFGVFRAQRTGTEERVDLGDEGVASGLALFARRGRHYLEALAGTEDAAAEALGLARDVLARLPAEGPPVAEPAGLPREGLRTVRFDRRDALGVEGLKDAFVALYADGTRLVVADYPAAEAAQAAAREAEEMLAFLGEPVSSGVVGRRLVLVVGPAEEARRIALRDRLLEAGGKDGEGAR